MRSIANLSLWAVVAMALLAAFSGRAADGVLGVRINLSTTLSTKSAAVSEEVRSVPFFPAAADPLKRQGFAQVVNNSPFPGTASITAFDDAGREYGPIELSLGGADAVFFNSADLEDGNPDKGMAEGVGRPSEGDWRLEITSGLDIDVYSYVRTGDGFVTAMHDIAPVVSEEHQVVFFNPGSNSDQVSRLRVVNLDNRSVSVRISGRDSDGSFARGSVRVSVPAFGARAISAEDLENGTADQTGAFGDGDGKWRLEVDANAPLQVMSLLETPTGHITNLSTAPTLLADMDQSPSATGSGLDAPKVVIISTVKGYGATVWAVEVGDAYAWDLQARILGRNDVWGAWRGDCVSTSAAPETTVAKIFMDVDVSGGDPIGSGDVLQVRYRNRPGGYCSSSPGPWSPIGQDTY